MAAFSVAALVEGADHAGSSDGASSVGQAAVAGRVVRIALWRSDGQVSRARFGATTCASLIASAEVACRALEAGVAPGRLDGRLIRSYIAGLHPGHRDRADLVAMAIRAALEHEARVTPPSTPGSQSP